ncbi:MAG: isoprenylcysteine carboxylmethyltransferase family protein [Chloroflexi bacterium]|nr:isoprenylcysteine carboxylmethyltransferase family protein [Chloroflexota bacterium]
MLWLVLSVLLWGLLHSLFASHKAKELARQVFGPRVNRFYRLAYNVFAGVSFLPVLAVMFLVPDRTLYLVPLPWSGLMVLGELLAVAALVIGFRQTDAWEFLGLRQPGESDKPSKLTASGLYQYVRHPLYSAGLAFIWLLPLMTVNVLAVNIALTIYVITGAYFEERKLRGEFGQDYADYMAVTPMFIPFLKGNKSPRKAS